MQFFADVANGSEYIPNSVPVVTVHDWKSVTFATVAGQQAYPLTGIATDIDQIASIRADDRNLDWLGPDVAERTFTVEIPAGIAGGQTLRLGGRGAAGPRGGAIGDLYVHVRVADHDRYRREEDDLVTDVVVSLAQAALGTTLTLPTLDGDEELVVPAGVQHGREFVLRGRGVPRLVSSGRSRGRGDLRARIVVEVPTDLTSEQRELLRRFAESRGEDVAADEGLLSKIKSAFS
jgi:molecular chaperone DnaJ